MNIEALAIGDNPPEDVNVIVEVPVGSQPIKYELDKEAGVLVVDRSFIPPWPTPGTTASCLIPCARTATPSTWWCATTASSCPVA